MRFSHSVGYRGVCVLGNQYLLCTGGSIGLSQDPIMGTGVWGAGYQNVSNISYAWNYLSLQGSANFELTTAGQWGELQSFVNDDRTTAKSILLKPDGGNGFNGSGWFTQCSFQASQGAAVTGTIGFKGEPFPYDSLGAADGTKGIIAKGSTNEITASGAANVNEASSFSGATLIPYWNTWINQGSTGASATSKGNGTMLNDIINWNCSCNADLQVLKCCGRSNKENSSVNAPLNADYIFCGQLSGDASLTMFGVRGQFNPDDYHQVKNNVVFSLGSTAFILIPNLVINNASTSMTTGASYITAEFSYNALGDGTNALMTLGKASK